MDVTEEPRALDRSSIESSDNIEPLKLQPTDRSSTSENDDETSSRVSDASDEDLYIPIPADDTDENILAAAAEQHKFINRACVNPTLCDLCRKCIGDIITGACFVDAASERNSRWTYEQTPMNRWGSELSFRFYENIRSVEASALRGCKLCLLISRGSWQFDSPQMYISVTRLREGTLKTYDTIKNTTKELWMINSWMDGLPYHQAFFPFVQNVDRQVTHFRQEEWYLCHTGSEEVMDNIRTWMLECLVTHTQCARKTPSSLPMRVIDVGRVDSLEDPYLLESSGQVAPYLALSYCWGTGKRFVSTQDSISRRREGFMLAELPETLRDAILVTRRLGVRYLWVDALCIIQDDDDDWQSESSNMRAIYRNASFVISASDASHSDSGMFYDRTALIASSDDFSAKNAALYIREDPLSRKYWTSHRQHPLSERAWALQERFMATALLHFSRQRLYWECRTQNIFEDGERRDNHPITKDLGRSTDVKQSTDERDWYHLVSLYLQRQLTYNTDKLAAIAGLATEFEEQGWCSGYSVGLWRSDILRGLLWTTGDNYEDAEQFAKREINPLFPSWSWASYDKSFVSWDLYNPGETRIRTRYDSDVESLRVDLSDQSKAAITVKGSMTFKAFMVLLSQDELVLSRIQSWRQDLIFIKREALPHHGLGYLNVPTKRPCWLIRMATWKEQLGSENPVRFNTSFLLLEEAGDENVFRRVGIYKRCHDDPDEQLTIHDMVRREITII